MAHPSIPSIPTISTTAVAAASPTPPTPPLVSRRAFVSSTYVDLAPHRDAVRRVLQRMEQFPVIMESFGAHGTGDATSVSLDKLASAQVYIGIFAWRYGYVPSDSALSVTHQEYRAAASLPRYIFLADPTTDADQSPGALFPASVRDLAQRDALLAFRREAGLQVVDFFTTPDDLAAKVSTALHHYLLAEQWRDYLATAGRRAPRLLLSPVRGFVGRGTECDTLCRSLRQGQSIGVVAAVSGMGGVGKSALASEVSHRLAAERDSFPAGIVAAHCDNQTGLDGLSAVYDQLLAAWDITLSREEQAEATTSESAAALRERALRRLLRPPLPQAEASNAALVLLDNVERDFPLPRALATLTSLGVTCLLTLRHQPSARGIPIQVLPLDVLEPVPAVELFVERYRSGGGAWDVARDRAPAEQVVEYLGRLPLAIELAAARCARFHRALPQPVLALQQELAEADGMGRLRDPLDPTQSVRYVLGRSLEGLSPAQRVCFAALGLLSGVDWPRPLVEDLFTRLTSPAPAPAPAPPPAPAPTSPISSRAASDTIEVFVALSLVSLPASATAESAPDQTQASASLSRVRVHPLLRDLAREEWQTAPSPWQPHLSATRDTATLALLDTVTAFVDHYEHDFPALAREEELIAGLIHASATLPAAATRVDSLIEALIDYLYLGGHWHLGLDLLGVQLAIRREVGDRRGEGATLNNLGYLANSVGRKEEALTYYQQALTIRREVGDRAGEGTTLNNLGLLADSVGRKEEALTYYQQALTIRREVGDRAGEGATLNNLGSLADDLGRKEEALTYYQQALAIFGAIGAVESVRVVAGNIAALKNPPAKPRRRRWRWPWQR